MSTTSPNIHCPIGLATKDKASILEACVDSVINEITPVLDSAAEEELQVQERSQNRQKQQILKTFLEEEVIKRKQDEPTSISPTGTEVPVRQVLKKLWVDVNNSLVEVSNCRKIYPKQCTQHLSKQYRYDYLRYRKYAENSSKQSVSDKEERGNDMDTSSDNSDTAVILSELMKKAQSVQDEVTRAIEVNHLLQEHTLSDGGFCKENKHLTTNLNETPSEIMEIESFPVIRNIFGNTV